MAHDAGRYGDIFIEQGVTDVKGAFVAMAFATTAEVRASLSLSLSDPANLY